MKSPIYSALLLGLSFGFILTPAMAQKVLFADSFDRPADTNLNASAVGKSGTLGALDWIEMASSADPVIGNERLVLGETGAGGGWSIAYPDHNFITPDLLTTGEFTVKVDLAGISPNGNTRFTGLAVGHSQAEVSGWSQNTPGNFSSDFFFGYDNTGTTEIKIFINGGNQDYRQTIDLNGGAELSVRFSGFSDFNAGSSVNYEAFVDGTSVKTGSFTWSGTGENYIALYSNYTNSTGILDNFEINTPSQDDDGDGLPNWWEELYFNSPTAAKPGDDVPDGDGLTNLEEYQLGTSPALTDTDDDGLNDSVETATGIWVDANDTGTSPTADDTDGDDLEDGVETNTGSYLSSIDTGTNPLLWDTDLDGLSDGIESNTGTFVDADDPGTNPLLADTDQDGAGDWYEITASFTDPLNTNDKPNVPYPLPAPEPLDFGVTDRPVKVYILSGQSNMVGEGTVSGPGGITLETMTQRQNKFPNLIDENGNFVARQDVRYRGVISAIGNGPLAPGFGKSSAFFGPELGFGQIMGWYHDGPVLLIKSCTGNRSLGFDVLPPGSTSYEYGGSVFGGYGQAGNWAIGEEPDPNPSWWAGREWDRFFADESDFIRPQSAAFNVVDVLDNFASEYPQWADQGFEIAGFVWWQGDKDRYEMGHATRYEQNLVNLITSLRNYYGNRYPGKVAANAPFVLATLGQTPLDSTNPAEKAILDAKLAVDGEAGNYPQFSGNVKTVYAHPLSEGGASNGHYNQRAGTYLLVGDALGRSMVELLDNQSGGQTFDQWMAGQGSGLNTGFDEDADSDGIDNGVEAFFGTRPFVADHGLAVTTLTGNALSFTHPQNSQPLTDVIGSYEWSLDLSAWHPSGANVNGTTVSFDAIQNQPATGTTTVNATINGTLPGAIFVRATASRP